MDLAVEFALPVAAFVIVGAVFSRLYADNREAIRGGVKAGAVALVLFVGVRLTMLG